ncbi:hypothetical protein Taro_009649 [Colocasia esculenta]|uniref:Uncharacterized protein n=1 Tax=Colocasia esculenta TaxID=4460 RepID=A0A843U5G9_COLES|nr:hypothetical protein [Colocasia esculenta]
MDLQTYSEMVRKELLLEDSLAIAENIKNNMIKKEQGTMSKRPPAVVGTKRPMGQVGNQQVRKFKDGGYLQAPINKEPCKHCDKTSHKSKNCWKALGRCLRYVRKQINNHTKDTRNLSWFGPSHMEVLRPVPKQPLGISLTNGTVPLKDLTTPSTPAGLLLFPGQEGSPLLLQAQKQTSWYKPQCGSARHKLLARFYTAYSPTAGQDVFLIKERTVLRVLQEWPLPKNSQQKFSPRITISIGRMEKREGA